MPTSLTDHLFYPFTQSHPNRALVYPNYLKTPIAQHTRSALSTTLKHYHSLSTPTTFDPSVSEDLTHMQQHLAHYHSHPLLKLHSETRYWSCMQQLHAAGFILIYQRSWMHDVYEYQDLPHLDPLSDQLQMPTITHPEHFEQALTHHSVWMHPQGFLLTTSSRSDRFAYESKSTQSQLLLEELSDQSRHFLYHATLYTLLDIGTIDPQFHLYPIHELHELIWIDQPYAGYVQSAHCDLLTQHEVKNFFSLLERSHGPAGFARWTQAVEHAPHCALPAYLFQRELYFSSVPIGSAQVHQDFEHHYAQPLNRCHQHMLQTIQSRLNEQLSEPQAVTVPIQPTITSLSATQQSPSTYPGTNSLTHQHMCSTIGAPSTPLFVSTFERTLQLLHLQLHAQNPQKHPLVDHWNTLRPDPIGWALHHPQHDPFTEEQRTELLKVYFSLTPLQITVLDQLTQLDQLFSTIFFTLPQPLQTLCTSYQNGFDQSYPFLDTPQLHTHLKPFFPYLYASLERHFDLRNAQLVGHQHHYLLQPPYALTPLKQHHAVAGSFAHLRADVMGHFFLHLLCSHPLSPSACPLRNTHLHEQDLSETRIQLHKLINTIVPLSTLFKIHQVPSDINTMGSISTRSAQPSLHHLYEDVLHTDSLRVYIHDFLHVQSAPNSHPLRHQTPWAYTHPLHLLLYSFVHQKVDPLMKKDTFSNVQIHQLKKSAKTLCTQLRDLVHSLRPLEAQRLLITPDVRSEHFIDHLFLSLKLLPKLLPNPHALHCVVQAYQDIAWTYLDLCSDLLSQQPPDGLRLANPFTALFSARSMHLPEHTSSCSHLSITLPLWEQLLQHPLFIQTCNPKGQIFYSHVFLHDAQHGYTKNHHSFELQSQGKDALMLLRQMPFAQAAKCASLLEQHLLLSHTLAPNENHDLKSDSSSKPLRL